MASVKLCPKCGGKLVAIGERTGGFSGKKAVVGAVVAGPVGVAAGALGKQLVTLKCEKCGYTVETDAKSAEAAKQYGSTHEIMENLQRSIVNMQSTGTVSAWSFDMCRKMLGESLTTQRLQHTTIATDGVICAAVRSDGTVAFAFSSEHPNYYKHEASEYSQVKEWKNVVSIAVGGGRFFGVREDGKVEVAGAAPEIEATVKSWSDIVMIAASNFSSPEAPVLGLRSDGTVVAVGENTAGMCDVSDWKNIVMIACFSSTEDGYTLSLRADGTVAVAGKYNYNSMGSDVSTWTNVINLYANLNEPIGIQANGSICGTTGIFNRVAQAKENTKGAVAVFGCGLAKGILTLDGTIYENKDAMGKLNDGKETVAAAAASVASRVILLLKKDGTVTLVTDFNLNKEKLQPLKTEVEAWTDIRVLPQCKERVEIFAEMRQMEAEEKACKAETEQKARAEQKQKNKKIALVVAAAVVVVAIIAVVFNTVVKPANEYKAAVALYEQGQYDEAIEAFTALGDYKDSAEMIATVEAARNETRNAEDYDKATALYAGEDYEAAARVFAALGGYKDSAEQAAKAERGAKYQEGLELLEKEQYDEARAAFEAAGDHADAEEYLGFEGISTHSFRKWYATEIYKANGYDIALVQRLLQHSSAAVTQRYIGIEPQRIEAAIQNHAQLI